ncbi:MAG: aspartate-semialdehyde dehydrogenase [Bacteroidetes bacterium]|nr:aspartate-semialdehyde dehydrogenase [Bacteroidota bacterium]
MKIALVGATGMVGTEMLKVLEESMLPVDELIPVATERSLGKKVKFRDREFPCVLLEDAIKANTDVALFSAGGNISLEWAPRFAENGTFVVDNSSAWRMHPDHKLVVPEINADVLTSEDKIIANPNCSTIQLVMALYPLHKKYGIDRLVISTYQSVSGTGYKAVEQMKYERVHDQSPEDKVYPHRIDMNCIPQCDVFTENGYTKEEMKMVNETRKILRDPSIRITATAVRIPTDGGHSESVNIRLKKEFDINDVRKELAEMQGVVVLDDPANSVYPMPLNAKGTNEVYVGRIRRDESDDNTLNLWIVSDNLRKGAATNTVQIAEYLYNNKLIPKQK